MFKSNSLTSIIIFVMALTMIFSFASVTLAEESDLSGKVVQWRFPLADNQDKETEAWNTVKERFQEKHPDVEIEIQKQPWDNRTQKLLTALAARRGPDVFYINPDMIPMFADKGAIAPFDKYVDEEELEVYNPGALIEWDDQIWGLPFLQNAVVYTYNLDLVEEIGKDPNDLPKTISEFEEFARAAKEKGYFIQNYQGTTTTSHLIEFIWKFGGEMFDEEGNITLDSPEVIEALTFIKKMYDNGWIPENSPTETEGHADMFRTGKIVSFQLDGCHVLGSTDSYIGDFDWDFGPLLKGKNETVKMTVGTYTMTQKCEDKEAAAAWIKHLTAPENSVLLNSTTGFFPPVRNAAEYYEDERTKELLNRISGHLRTDPVWPVARQAYIIMQEEQQAMMIGKKTPEEAAAAMQRRVEKARKDLQ